MNRFDVNDNAETWCYHLLRPVELELNLPLKEQPGYFGTIDVRTDQQHSY